MAEETAKLTIGIEGAEEAVAAAQRVKGAWSSVASGLGSGFATAGKAIGDAVGGMISDLVRLGTVAQGINFASAVESAKKYQETVARMSAFTGQNITTLKSQYQDLSKKKLVDESEVIRFHQALTRVTYDAKGSQEAFAGLADAAKATGRTNEEMIPIGTILHNVLGVTGDTTDALGRMAAQAGQLGVVGGPSALFDILQATSGVLEGIDKTAPNAAAKVTALLAGIGGKGASAQDKAKTVNTVLGSIESDPFGYMQVFMGKSMKKYLNKETGHVEDPLQLMADMQKKMKKDFGKEGAWDKAVMSWGPVQGATFMSTDFDAAIKARKDGKVSPQFGDAAQGYSNTAAGKQKAADIAKDMAGRDVAGGTLPFLSAMTGFIAAHPVLGTIGTSVGGAAAQGAVRGGFGGLGKMLGGLFGGGEATAGAAAKGAGAATELAESFALKGLTSEGAGVVGGAGAGAMAAAIGIGIGAGLAATGGVLASVGKNRDTMGKEYREEHADIIGKEAAMIAKRKAEHEADLSTGDENTKEYQDVLKLGGSPKLAGETVRNMRDQGMEITIINQTGGPIQAVQQTANQSVQQH